VVPERLVQPHPATTQLRAAFARRHPAEGIPLWGRGHAVVRVGDKDRALRVLDALFKALVDRGHEVRFHKVRHYSDEVGAMDAVVGDRVVEFWLVERSKRTEHVLTTEEKAQKAKCGWSFASKYDFAASGQFTLEVDVPWDGSGRYRWSDGVKQRLENMLGRIVLGIEEAASRWKADDIRREREAREHDKAVRRQRAAERRADHRRVLAKDLSTMAYRWQKSSTIRCE
jgi:hypothetical protein